MDNDATFKAIFSHRIMVRELLEWFVAGLHGERGLVDALDLSELRRRPEQSVAMRPGQPRRYAGDLVWEAPFADSPHADPNAWLRLLLMLEFQRAPDWLMALRIRNYADGQYMEEWRARGMRFRRGDRLPPVLPLVLYTGRAPWRVAQRVVDLVNPPATAPAAPGSRSLRNDLFAGDGHLALDIHRLRSEDFRDDNAASLLAALTNPTPDKAARQAAALVSRLAGPELRDLRELALAWVRQESRLDLGVDEMDAVDNLAPAEREEQFEERVVFWHERFHAEGHAEGLAEGHAHGLAEGHADGLVEGHADGLAQGLAEARADERELLRRLAMRKFDARTAARLDGLLAGMDDAARLAEVGEWLID